MTLVNEDLAPVLVVAGADRIQGESAEKPKIESVSLIPVFLLSPYVAVV